MRECKRGVMGSGIVTVIRVLMVSFIALVVLGLSGVFYTHYIDVRSVEAGIMARNLIECVAPEGAVNLDSYSVKETNEILDYCGYSDFSDRFYVRMNFYQGDGSPIQGKIDEFSQGDPGLLWVVSFFKENEDKITSNEALKSQPGHFKKVYPITIYPGAKGQVRVEVLVKDE